mmetsp:Transcript_22733/g.26340  ORF Transcript_22733/g.26340 Transcript_22733/m.26340 type:complete len:310 (-) Transcript_22733:135-1064(-)
MMKHKCILATITICLLLHVVVFSNSLAFVIFSTTQVGLTRTQSESKFALFHTKNNNNQNEMSNYEKPLSKIEQQQQHQEQLNDQTTTMSRRDAISKTTQSCMMGVLGLTMLSSQSFNAVAASTQSTVRIDQYPSLEYLEPIYELKLSVDALKIGAADPSKWKFIKKRLDKLFSGGIFSEKNYLLGLSIMYANQIKYSESELPEYIKLDKEQRLRFMEETLQNLESLTKVLGSTDINADAVQRDVDSAQTSILAWFSMVPTEDISNVDKFFKVTRIADNNRDGKLDTAELSTLSESDREMWLRRVTLFGD